MEQRKLGSAGPIVSAIGFGCMSIGIADVYTSSAQSDQDAIDIIHRALDLGINFLDTANIYGDSELKVGKAIRGRRDGVIVATKFGFTTSTSSEERRGDAIDGRPESVRRSCDQSLQRLGIEQIDLYYLHRVDPKVPIEETAGAMADLVRDGKVRHLGISEAASDTVRRAHRVHPIAAVQTEYSLFSREPEEGLLQTLRELGIALVAYSPLGRGFLSGRFHSLDDLAPGDWRRGNPRFQGEQFQKNVATAELLVVFAGANDSIAAEEAHEGHFVQVHDCVSVLKFPICSGHTLAKPGEWVRLPRPKFCIYGGSVADGNRNRRRHKPKQKNEPAAGRRIDPEAVTVQKAGYIRETPS